MLDKIMDPRASEAVAFMRPDGAKASADYESVTSRYLENSE
jgi:hypothetical protein